MNFFTRHRELAEIEQSYQNGESSETIAGRETNFNNALTLMQKLDWNTGEYYYDMGNSYYQLQQYPWALFYYLKAEQQLPRDRDVKNNLSATLQKLDLPTQKHSPIIPLSFQEEILIAQMLIFLTLLGYSLKLWIFTSQQSFSKAVRGCLIATAVYILTLIAQFYLTPVHAVLAEAAILYKTPGNLSERVFLDPLPPGEILRVIGESDEGSWIKIVNEKGVVGYVESDKLLI